MAGRADASRDLRLGLRALESGAIDSEQLVSALRAWSRSADRSLSEILAGRGLLDATALQRLEDRAAESPAPGRPDPEGADASRTLTYAGRAPTEEDCARDGGAGPGGDVGAGGRYRVVHLHARGGLGEVFLAEDLQLNRTVALKALPARTAHDADARTRFLAEAEITGRLEHPGIVPVYSVGRSTDGRPYFAMRLIAGEDLRQAIERFHRARPATREGADREPAFRRLLRSLIDACNAVAYAHSRGVVHRDLKPENIMLGPFGETLVVDWGVSRSLGESEAGADERHGPAGDASLTRPGSVLGTPRYMSPEQASGDRDRVGPASDIYSLGAILYCLLVGHAPVPEGDVATVLDRVRRGIFPAPRRLRRSIDPTLEAICLKAMSPRAESRHATALELANDLEAWQADVRYRGEQADALGEAKGALARLYLERAHACFGREARDEGMLWLARALEVAPPGPPDLHRVIRTSLRGWHAGTKLLERSFRHNDEVHALAFCPEGRRLATACGDRTARLWDVSTGSPLAPPLKHRGAVHIVAFDPGGRTLATAGDDGLILRWDAMTGAPVGPPLRADGPITALAFRPDGSTIAAGGPSGFSLWDVETGVSVHEGDAPGLAVRSLAFAPDGATLAVACDDGAVHLRDAATGTPLGEPLAHGSAAPGVAFDPVGRMLLTGGHDGIARLWDIDRRATAVSLPHAGRVGCVEFRPGGGAFATSCERGGARLWDAVTGLPIGEPLLHRAGVDRLAFRPDGSIVATGGRDGTARLWCAATALPVGPPLTHGAAVLGLAFSRDGRRLASNGADAIVRCWKAPDAIEGGVERVACWVRVETGLEFDAGDAIRRMDGPTIWELRRRLSDLGGSPVR